MPAMDLLLAQPNRIGGTTTLLYHVVVIRFDLNRPLPSAARWRRQS